MRDLPPGPVELAATSNFSFLRGASHPEELVAQAAALGLAGIAIADRNSVAGVVRGHMAAKEAGIAYAPACRLTPPPRCSSGPRAGAAGPRSASS